MVEFQKIQESIEQMSYDNFEDESFTGKIQPRKKVRNPNKQSFKKAPKSFKRRWLDDAESDEKNYERIHYTKFEDED